MNRESAKPSEMTPEQRCCELAEILATGFLRLLNAGKDGNSRPKLPDKRALNSGFGP